SLSKSTKRSISIALPDLISIASRSLFDSAMYLPFSTSYPLRILLQGTSFLSFVQTRLNCIGLLSLGHSRRKPILCSDTAPNPLTGMLTRPKVMDPLQVALGKV